MITLEEKRPLSTGFVGRQQEMERLKVALTEAFAGRASVSRLREMTGGVAYVIER